LANFLAEAYSAAQRTKEADALRRAAANLVPPEHPLRLLRNGN
jgi:hypothetical protein